LGFGFRVARVRIRGLGFRDFLWFNDQRKSKINPRDFYFFFFSKTILPRYPEGTTRASQWKKREGNVSISKHFTKFESVFYDVMKKTISH
jgi:hypothetical protein